MLRCLYFYGFQDRTNTESSSLSAIPNQEEGYTEAYENGWTI